MADYSEKRVEAHKGFVFERGGWVLLELVADERPITRMTLTLSSDVARDIAAALCDAAAGIEATEATVKG